MSKPVKLPSGSWRIQFFDSNGKRRSETFKTLDAARSALRRRETEVEDIRAGRARPRSDQTIASAYEAWLASREPKPGSPPDVMRRRGKRVKDNRMHLEKHVIPELGHLRLPEVNADVIQRFIRTLEAKPTSRKGEVNKDGRTLRPATIANVIITLRKMLTDLGYPVRVSYKVPTSRYGWIKTPADVARFLAECKGWFRIACELACYAGLRQGEVAGLTWRSVDFERGIISIDRSYDGPTKSKHERTVPLAPDLAAQLRRWRLQTGAASAGLVVLMERRGYDQPLPIDEDSDLGKRVRRACKRAGVEPVTFHQLRHTMASHLAERIPPAVVGAVLGHADPKTTARYVHVDTASLARDPRLHLQFTAPAGKVSAMPNAPTDPTAHAVHTDGTDEAAG